MHVHKLSILQTSYTQYCLWGGFCLQTTAILVLVYLLVASSNTQLPTSEGMTATKAPEMIGQNELKMQSQEKTRENGNKKECNNGIFLLQHSYANDPTLHNPQKQRVVISLTAIPFEVEMLNDTILNPLFSYYHSPKGYWFDAIHLNIPYTVLRNFNVKSEEEEEEKKEEKARRENQLPKVNKNEHGDQSQTMTDYPDTHTLQQMFPQRHIIINRLFMDYGPMTRYIGPLRYERHPDTLILTFDVDSDMSFNQPNHLKHPVMTRNNFVHKDLRMLVYASKLQI
ncbi:hypothetical protein RFI_00633 [Reticulomyxa filosa]|uniref:Uncharacterized protein n=1 Tax=Reticulomyxa filosa TaxID=46433 RepID=X6PEH3_RETFI|nr:hypothetical protein RFI_00633 [Reticulomyxa filosa]|eukprot:ETO36429.1 hypothetical protein RFI_00633 [Reticulomyxa filosa]